MDQLSSGATQALGVETFSFRVWGRFAATRLADSADVTPRGRKARALLAYLLIEGKTVARDLLAGLLWSERGQAQAHASFRQCLFELREFAPILRVERHQLSVDKEAAGIDLAEMQCAAESGGADLLAAMLAGGGELLEDLDGFDPAFDQWLRAVRATRTPALLTAAHACGSQALEAGATDAAEALARTLLAIDPLDEVAARLAMAAAHRAGRQGSVQRVHDRFVADLDRELGVAPSAETRALHDRLVADPAADADERGPPAHEGAAPPVSASAPAPQLRPARAWRRRAIAASALLLLLIGAAALVVPRLLDRTGAGPISLAVLPFRNLSAGNADFAEGLAEEILTQLAREPQFRVAGRTSSWLFRDTADAREIGRRLDVEYVLEGHVRESGGRVRVDVALVDTDDGMRMWAQSFQGNLDDIFAIQGNIGRAVAGGLRRELVQVAPITGPLTTSGEVYNLYLTARRLIRTRDRQNIRTAIELLRRAVRLDPNYAPAWSSLGQADRLDFSRVQPPGHAEAMRYVDRALALAPDLAEAHAVKGLILGFTPGAVRQLERAVQLDPHHAEAWHWLSVARQVLGDTDGAFQASRRVAEIDPFWIFSRGFAGNAWDRGLHAESIRFEQNLAANHPEASHRELARARMAARRGDWSGSALHLRRAAELDGGDSAIEIRNELADTLLLLGLPPVQAGNSSNWEQNFGRALVNLWFQVMNGELPPPASMASTLGRPDQYWNFEGWNLAAARLFLNRGRAADLVYFYDASFDSPDAMASASNLSAFTSLAPEVALALRAVGRHSEAGRMLALADRRDCRSAGLDRMPTSALVICSRIWAVQGRRGAAMVALQRAVSLSWPNGFLPNELWQPRPDMVEEPAWRSIRDDPRFRQIDAAVRANLARERRELLAAFVR